ncbi:MAG: hypothetical protein ACOYN8_02805 [Pseudanabaena sp.]|jgi:hypothetical protein
MPRKQSITIALDANLISQLETMETYKTYITIENPDRVVLSNLPFQVGQRVEIIVLPEYNRTAISQKLKALFKKTQALSEVSEITDADIETEINAYRNGK